MITRSSSELIDNLFIHISAVLKRQVADIEYIYLDETFYKYILENLENLKKTDDVNFDNQNVKKRKFSFDVKFENLQVKNTTLNLDFVQNHLSLEKMILANDIEAIDILFLSFFAKEKYYYHVIGNIMLFSLLHNRPIIYQLAKSKNVKYTDY